MTKCAYGAPKPEPEALKRGVTQAYLSMPAHQVTRQALFRGFLLDRVGFEIDHGVVEDGHQTHGLYFAHSHSSLLVEVLA